MVVPGEGARVAHAELTFGNSMIMLGDAETEYSNLVAAPAKGSAVSQGLYIVVPTPMRITSAPRRQEPRSCST
jgi:uncharacterized glyoxalase superfamily protein PhnB